MSEEKLVKNVNNILIEINEGEKCHEGKVVINDVELGKGIKSATIILDANSIPVVKIEYSPNHISENDYENLDLVWTDIGRINL